MFRLQLFGPIHLSATDGTQVRAVLAQPKRLALLAYLAAAMPEGFHRRDALLALFWPESTEAQARLALRQSLHYLRRTLGPSVIASRGSADVALGAEALWCDVVVFRQALVAGANAAALDLYRGDLLEGFSIAGISIELERWLEEERAVLKARAAAAAASLCKQAEGAGDLDLAVHWARRGLALSPDDESALRRLVRLLDRQGNRTGALRAVQEFARHALDELCAEPAAETQALVDEIRSRAQAHHVREPRALPSPAAHPTAEPPAAAPLISGGSGQHAPGVAALDDRAAHPWGTAALAVGVRLLGGLAETIVRLRDELESMGDASDGSPRRPDRKQA